MQYFVYFVSPGDAEADNGCGGQSFDRKLCQKYWCQKLFKSDDLSY